MLSELSQHSIPNLNTRPESSTLDRGELNLNDMKCVQREDGAWICTLPHHHLPLMNLVYEFSYTVKDDLTRAEYSCKNTSLPESNK